MPPPTPFPCGLRGQPSCPPEPAIGRTLNAINVLRWYRELSPQHKFAIDTWTEPVTTEEVVEYQRRQGMPGEDL
jgi:hypothetical protein